MRHKHKFNVNKPFLIDSLEPLDSDLLFISFVKKQKHTHDMHHAFETQVHQMIKEAEQLIISAPFLYNDLIEYRSYYIYVSKMVLAIDLVTLPGADSAVSHMYRGKQTIRQF